MLKPVFNIASDDIAADQWMHCRLMLLINAAYLQYAVLQDKNLLVWKHYQFPTSDPEETYRHIVEIADKDDVLRQPVKDRVIVYNYPENCLVPEALQNTDVNRHWLDMAHGNLSKGLVITEKVPGWNLYNVFRLPVALDHLSRTKFQNALFQHQTSLWLAGFRKQPDREDQLSIIFQAKEIDVSVLVRGNLLLAQSYSFKHPSDVVYHLLNICRQLGLDPKKFPVFISGLIEFSSFMFHELAKYFTEIEADALSEKFLISKNFRTVPEHFFTPLLKMSRCV